LITNLLKYGYRGRAKTGSAELALLLEESLLTIEMIDDGCAFDPFAAADPDFNRPLEARQPGGMGLRIVRLLAEGKHYSRVNDRNVVRVTLHLAAQPLAS